ncbi:Histone-lysine N-methyltransferase family member SUVH9 [Sesamum alatum]|uniref:Histone-lysine N-methyltransferase family member SUVH9 n=1 Tax=Sesamum alatum TaxID=300844 RepID=A0AAE1Y815_9LAMI|nr:Histone-lysine N-methyltransferase family member SUVH9 [Sesamum alatum]
MEMGSNSLVPFQDLNVFPEHPATSTSTLLVVPKIEPKLEPLDEPLPSPPAFNLSAPSPSPSPSPSSADVYSEFNRLSELFRSTLAQGLQGNGDMPSLPDSHPDSRALVPVENPEAHLSNVILTPRGSRKYQTRSSELVRVMDLKPEDERYFRDLIRKTRMLFDSLRVFAIAVDEKQKDLMVPHRRPRADLKAAAVMREHGLWLNRDKRVVGDIPGVTIGDVFFFRMELCVIGLHGQAQAGIDYVPSSQSSNGEPIATSIIVSGGYEDDEDAGDVIVYTGHGGQDKNNKQVVHQKLECGNLALERSMNYGIEVRVIRGFKYEGSVSGKVYVYDGLYRIIETWFDVGKSGFGVFKFKLVRIENQAEMGSTIMKFAAGLRTRPLDARPRGILVRGKPLIFECGPHCRCPPSCRNRVAQKGVRNRFEVFRSTETGWGVRSLDLIPAGAFICEYAGVVLTREQVQVFTMNGDSLIYPSRFAERWREWGNLSEVFCDYKCPEDPSTPPLDFAMDVSRMRNVACYMSHSSSPNVLVQLVLYDHNNVSFPHLMLFAMENIPPMRELSLDYGVADEYMGKLAICN